MISARPEPLSGHGPDAPDGSPSAAPPPRTPSAAEASDTAWRIHAALGEWTARVDTKASFALTLETAALVGIAGLVTSGSFPVRALDGPLLVMFVAALLSVLASALFAVLVVLPRMRGRQAEAEAPYNFVYFGHLRHWDPERLQEALCERDPLPMLSRQLVTMSRIVWRKHRCVELSFLLAVAGVGLLVLLLFLS
ncbi:Pycsar system effector family protein [Streptomyces sp. NPDC002889]|uniref:Pycsar system effector family protein n=1 Tax=Streptomyces sp. NPDC002889 TaxID=3364669 RepID=UPI0036998182